MKRWIKKIKVIIPTACALAVMTGGVYAYNETSGYLTSPKFVLNTWTHGNTYNLKSAKSTPSCSDANMVVYSRDGSVGFLEANYYSSYSDRSFQIQLKDEDFGNDNDILKKYKGEFSGRTLVTITKTSTSSGSIDGNGDKQGELYITGYLEKKNGDIGRPGGTELFDYSITID